MTPNSIVFYDGLCGLCDTAVQFLISVDTRHRLHFSPLQGETARHILSDIQRRRLDSLVFYYNGQTIEKSTAILSILKVIGGPWVIVYGLILIPRFMRDIAYDLIANNRYRLFGKFDQCKIPSPQQRSQFLD